MSAARPIATTRSAAGLPTGRLGVWWVIASEVVIFGGLLSSYVMHRLAHPPWAGPGALNPWVLLTSSLCAVRGHKAAESGDGPKAARFIYLTMLGGATFIVVKAFEWTSEISHGFTITSSTF